jgi:hypothetical protein
MRMLLEVNKSTPHWADKGYIQNDTNRIISKQKKEEEGESGPNLHW